MIVVFRCVSHPDKCSLKTAPEHPCVATCYPNGIKGKHGKLKGACIMKLGVEVIYEYIYREDES